MVNLELDIRDAVIDFSTCYNNWEPFAASEQRELTLYGTSPTEPLAMLVPQAEKQHFQLLEFEHTGACSLGHAEHYSLVVRNVTSRSRHLYLALMVRAHTPESAEQVNAWLRELTEAAWVR